MERALTLSAAFLAPAPFGLKLLIGHAAVDDGPKVRALAIAGDVAFGSAHGILRYRPLSRPPLSVTNVAWLAPYALPPGTETFTFRDMTPRTRPVRSLKHFTTALNKLRNRFRRRFAPSEVQRLEQRSHTPVER